MILNPTAGSKGIHLLSVMCAQPMAMSQQVTVVWFYGLFMCKFSAYLQGKYIARRRDSLAVPGKRRAAFPVPWHVPPIVIGN